MKAGELLQNRHHVLGLAVPAHLDRQAEAAVLVNHVQELESAAITSGVEREVQGSQLVGMPGPMAPHRAVGPSECGQRRSRGDDAAAWAPPGR